MAVDPSLTTSAALEDVHSRFILNLPDEELSSPIRIFFQLEQAWWYYDDVFCDKNPQIQRFTNHKTFAKQMCSFSPLLVDLVKNFDSHWSEFSKYKRSIGTYGTALLNDECTHIILCQTYDEKRWTFPGGKVNQDESGKDAAARETHEETGFDLVDHGFVLRKEDSVSYFEEALNKRRTLYIVRGVPKDFPFAPIAQKEVSKIEWHPLKEIPKNTFAVMPFISQIKRWIRKNTSRAPSRANSRSKSSGKKGRSSSRGSRASSVAKKKDDVVISGLVNIGEENRWSEEQMFAVNEKLMGRKVDYSGSPHEFSEKSAVDPHHFRVVGGTFMNSNLSEVSRPPDSSKLQPLFRKNDVASTSLDGDRELEPFFSSDGKAPWDLRVQNDPTIVPDQALAQEGVKVAAAMKDAKVIRVVSGDGRFLPTDAEVTARSQKEKLLSSSKDIEADSIHFQKCLEWVKSLERPSGASKIFGKFKFDVDEIMAAAKAAATV